MPRSPTARLPIGPAKPRVPILAMRVWDAPTRLFHGAIILLVAFSYISIRQGWFQLHLLSGDITLALLIFRLAWGFIGSETSRFRNFLRSPLRGLQHLARFGRREPDTEIGHNAAGGWMILALLAILFAEIATGLFSPGAPLAHHLSLPLSTEIAGWHNALFLVILALTALHIVAILAYALVKRHDLVRAMVTGKKRLPANMRQPRFASPLLALLTLALSAAATWALVTFG